MTGRSSMDQAAYLFISPHLDDAVFSCGGFIRQLVLSGSRVIVATVVTADAPDELPLGWLAKRNLRSWGNQRHIFALRCAEDLAAVRHLGAETLHLGFLDCIYRRDAQQLPLYTRRVINVPLHPYDLQFFQPALETRLRELLVQAIKVVCPLTIGNHVDHLLVRQAVEAVTTARQRIYYEEFPYILRTGKHHTKWVNLSQQMIRLQPAEIEARLLASTSYRSQIPGLFPAPLDVWCEIMRAYLPVLDRYVPAEHPLWHSIKRMQTITRRHIDRVGGERYWTQPL